MTTRFESGKTYMVGSRCDRVYFKVVARTAKTATIELIGIQRNASQYDEIKIDVAGTGETQKTRLHIENDMEFGYLKVETENAWGIAYTDRVCIEPKKAVTISSTVEENTEPTAENNTDNTDTTTEAEENTEADIEKYLAAKEEVSFKYNKAGAKMWYHARAIIGTGPFNYGKFAGWSVDHDVKINRNEAASYLKKYGLTVEQFVAAEKEFYAIRYPKDETTTEAEENTAQVEYKPQTAWENPHDFTTVGNLNGQPRKYVEVEAIAAPKGFWTKRINGTYDTHINGEFVSFENHSIAYIDAEKKLGYHYKKSDAGRKIFYRGNQRFAASKIVEAYMNGEIAAEQNKAHHEFFDAHKTAYNKFFQVLFRVTTVDGNVHNFERTFDSFDDAKALVDKFTATFSEPADILIKRNGRLAPVYYTRTDGLPGTYTMFYFGNDGFDPEVFSLLPALDDLNDVEDEINADDAAEDNVETEPATVEDKPTKKATAKVDRLAELKGSKLLIYKAINNALRNHYVKLESGEFYDASDAGFTTTGFDADRPEFEKLYFKDDSGAYVEVSDKALAAFNRLEVELRYIYKAIDAEIARTAVKFEVGKWYASDEMNFGDGYRVLKRSEKFVTIYDSNNDDWNDLDNYDPDDEIDGEFDCIFRKKIQLDERGEYVEWRDENGELVTLCAKDVTEPVDEDPDDDDPDDDAEDDADNDSADDNVEAEDATEPREGDWEISNKLTRKLNRNVRLSNYTEVITQDGERTFVNFGAPHVEPDGNTDHGFAFVHYDTTLGRYDTREQAETVINRITATVERGEEKFIFPTVEELTAPKGFTAKLAKLEAERDVAQKNVDEKQAVLIKAQAEHEKAVETWRESNCAIDRLYRAEVQSLSEKLLPLNIAAVKVTKQDGYTDYVYAETLVIWYDEGKFIIRGDCSIKKYCLLAKYDTPEQVTRVINGLKAATEHETKFKFPTVEELNQPSKDDLRGSLKRAAEIALKKYHEYEREGDNDGMLYEIELYSICADAIKDLEAA